MVELAFALPIFLALILSIVVFALYLFYNQQLANAAREAARYAATHSSTAQCPTVSRLDPPDSLRSGAYFRCDAPENGWPRMTAAARSKVWGMNPASVTLTACWSGHVDAQGNPDALPSPAPSQPSNAFTNCTMQGVDPRSDPSAVGCPAPATAGSAFAPAKADGDDKASDLAAGVGNNTPYATTVTVYACSNWSPPLAGFVLIPPQITLRAVITEALQRQQ
jgi:hypothetical protein